MYGRREAVSGDRASQRQPRDRPQRAMIGPALAGRPFDSFRTPGGKDVHGNDPGCVSWWRRRWVVAGLAALAPAGCATGGGGGADPLPSWNDGANKQAILKFVGDVTREGASTLVAPAERIAVFDNDGTLWIEQPMYTQTGVHVRPGEGQRGQPPRVARQRGVQGACSQRPPGVGGDERTRTAGVSAVRPRRHQRRGLRCRRRAIGSAARATPSSIARTPSWCTSLSSSC